MVDNKQKQSGFTIVELLIVIVVIGILAALVLSSFANAQKDARNAQTLSVVNAAKKALMAYGANNGRYPTESGCVGTGYPGGYCWTGPNGSRAVNATLNSQLQPYMGDPPTVSARQIDYTGGGDIRLGVSVRPVTVGAEQKYSLEYYMEGNDKKCTIGPIVSSNTFNRGSSQCILYLPDL